MIKDLVHRLAIEHTVKPQAFADSQGSALEGASIDIVGFRRIAFAVSLGDISAAGITVTFEGQKEDDNWEAISNDDLISDDNLTDLAEIAEDDDDTIHTFGLAVAEYKAVRAKVDSGTNDGAGDLAVLVMKQKKYDEPV